MDVASSGADSHLHMTTPPKQNKPPPVAKKPKPVLPKKPSIAQKPSTSLENSSNQNGNNSESHTTSPFPATISTSRPKEPPPSLPKVPPKGPAGNKPPPPLPKTPPRGPGGVRSPSVRSKPASALASASHPAVTQKHANSNGIPKPVGTSALIASSSPQSEPSNDHQVGLSSWYVSPSSPLPSNSSKQVSVTDATSASSVSQSRNGDERTSSTWYVSEVDDKTVVDSQEKHNSVKVNETQESQSSVRASPSKKLVKSSTVSEDPDSDGHLVINSSQCSENSIVSDSVSENSRPKNEPSVKRHKPPPSRSPPPPPPKRSPHVPANLDIASKSESHDCDHKNDNDSISSEQTDVTARQNTGNTSCENTFHNSEIQTSERKISVGNDRRPSEEPCVTPVVKNKQSSQTSLDESPSDSVFDSPSAGSHPIPTPRAKPGSKSRPTPKPAPRKSINRLSGSDFPSPSLMTSSVQNLSIEREDSNNTGVSRAKSEENLTSSPKRSVFSVWEERQDLAKSPLKSPSVPSRFFPTDSGRSQSKISTSDSSEGLDKIVLKKNFEKKIVGDISDASPKVSELMNRFTERSPSPSETGRTVVPNKSSPKPSPKPSRKPAVKYNKDSEGVPKVDSKNVDECFSDKDTEEDSVLSNEEKKSGSSKGSFEDLLSDKSILEPSSLLTEIEEILSRSYKINSLTRSGSSPEKKPDSITLKSPPKRYERSLSLDTGSQVEPDTTPIRPPRPKKEQRARTRSQIMYDSAGSDTESLSDFSRNSGDDRSVLSKSKMLGPAKPHPPKPKRHKLLKVQRSQSDVSAMKSFLEDQERGSESRRSPHKRQSSDGGLLQKHNSESPNVEKSGSLLHNTAVDINPVTGRAKSWRKTRPSRKAPPPPPVPPYKADSPSKVGNRLSLDTVVPVAACVSEKSKGGCTVKTDRIQDSAGSLYHSIDDPEAPISSDEDHDYHEIPEDLDTSGVSDYSKAKPKGNAVPWKEESPTKPGELSLRPPPQLPPRNFSLSFESSSPSSLCHENEFGDGSSLDDGSSGYLEPEVGLRIGAELKGEGHSPNSRPLKLKSYPKTSSPNVNSSRRSMGIDSQSEGMGNALSNLSLTDSLEGGGYTKIRSRPVSEVSQLSMQSDSGSGSHDSQMQEPISSSESEEEDDEQKKKRKRDKKLLMIAKEIMTSERVFVDILVLLNVDFRKHIASATEAAGRPVIPADTLNRILDYLPQLQNFNEDLLKDIEERINTWETGQGISDIFVRKGPFLKLYSSYIKDFETMNTTLDDAVKKYPTFHAALKEFELSERCAKLALKHYMLKPIQRIPQYRLLLQEYLKNLSPDSHEMEDMQTALRIVSEVAEHANENMRHGDYVQKMLEIQRSLIGQFEVIKPGRRFLREGELMKLSRKEMQPRFFYLFNDVLLYTTPVATGYRLNNVLPLAGMKVSVSGQDEYKTEFSIISVQRSFTLSAGNIEERDDWVSSLNSAIEENMHKRNTFEAVRHGAQTSWETYNKSLLDKDFVLGHKAPLWIPDARVTMCMLCTCEFTVTWRRHHCRACGRVVCGNCSDCKAPLRYLKYKTGRVCDECYKVLLQEVEKDAKETTDGHPVKEEEGSSFLNLNGLFERFQKIRRSGRSEKKLAVKRPAVLKEVHANDQGAEMSGYMSELQKGRKWKKLWFVLKKNVLYTYKASNDMAATKSLVLLGYEVTRFTDFFEGVEPNLLFQLSHANTQPIVLRTESATATEKWVTVIRESSIA